MIVPYPCSLRGAAAALILGNHLISFPDVVRHHSSHHLLQPAISSVVAVAFATKPTNAHDPFLGVIGVGPDAVPSHIADRIIADSHPVHTRYAVRLYSRHLFNQPILQLAAATHRIPHRRPISMPVIIIASRPCS